MEITLKNESDKLRITDEGFDSPLLWVKLTIENYDDDGSNIGLITMEVPHRELMAALIAFDAKRSRFEEEIRE